MILVVGAGRVGGAVAQLAGERLGTEVHTLTRGPRPGASGVHYVGDARAADLGLRVEEARALQERVEHIVVAAGRINLGLGFAEARAEHVAPVAGVVAFARRCARLQSVVLVSSLLALGRSTRSVRSDDLPPRPSFRNFYEWAKHEAERVARVSGLPVRVVRPGYVAPAVDDDAPVDDFLFGMVPVLARGWPVPLDAAARYWSAPAELVAEVVVALLGADSPSSAWAVDPDSPTCGQLVDLLGFRHGFPARTVAPRGVGRMLLAAARSRWVDVDVPPHAVEYADARWELDLRCLDALVSTGAVTLPSDRSYVEAVLDRAVATRRSLAG